MTATPAPLLTCCSEGEHDAGALSETEVGAVDGGQAEDVEEDVVPEDVTVQTLKQRHLRFCRVSLKAVCNQ